MNVLNTLFHHVPQFMRALTTSLFANHCIFFVGILDSSELGQNLGKLFDAIKTR